MCMRSEKKNNGKRRDKGLKPTVPGCISGLSLSVSHREKNMAATTPPSRPTDTLFPDAAPGKGTTDDVALEPLPASVVVELVVVVGLPGTVTTLVRV